MEFDIRTGAERDLPQVLELIKELAEFEKAREQVAMTLEQLTEDGFGERPLYGFIVAESQQHGVMGMALYYYRYSTWKGKFLYLEDIVVNESHRSKGLGYALMQKLKEIAKAENCAGLTWQVLDWNVDAIRFYERLGVSISNEWLNATILIDV
jgi:GNAT superfamily N-acetyltransferase